MMREITSTVPAATSLLSCNELTPAGRREGVMLTHTSLVSPIRATSAWRWPAVAGPAATRPDASPKASVEQDRRPHTPFGKQI